MRCIKSLSLALTVLAFALMDETAEANDRPNVLLIVCDDLNDYIEPLGGHPQAQTPNIQRLFDSSVSFTEAHCNIPICNPSRASFATGLYPHTSQLFGFEKWTENEILKNSRTMMAHFSAHGYRTLGTGKIMHSADKQEWDEVGHPTDYGPFASDNSGKNLPHPDSPSPFRDDFGAIDGSFGPLYHLDPEGDLFWRTGGWQKLRTLRYESDKDRDPTGDELNTQWAVEKLQHYAGKRSKEPFFLGVGFVRPHTPLIVPKKYFDKFPLEDIQLPEILDGDVEDTFKHTVTNEEADRGKMIYESLINSYGGDRDLALRKFIQAYLASVASIDDLVGKIVSVVDNSPLKNNTIIIFTSDHGWGMGEKNHLFKNSLWQESTRVPLSIRAPGVSKNGLTSDTPVTLVDLYPTLLDLCGLPDNTQKSDRGRPLDGHSLKPLLRNPAAGKWDGPDTALTALYKWATYFDPAFQSYSLRSKEWRYIRYENEAEELYHTTDDPHEWNNLALSPEHATQLASMRSQLLERIPESIPQPFKSDEDWKNDYFKKNPAADSDRNGKLSWAELKSHKESKEIEPPTNTSSTPERLQTQGVFSKNSEGGIIFTDESDGRVYYAIKEIGEQVVEYLDQKVTINARIKPATSGKVMMMVYLVNVRPTKK